MNNKRHGLSVIATVTNEGMMRRKFEGALDADVLVDFMKRLIKDAGRNVYLVPDNLRVHHGKPVKAWLAEHRREIDVFLPAQLQPGAQHQRDGHKQVVTKLVPARTKPQQARPRRRTCAAYSGSQSESRVTSIVSQLCMRFEFNTSVLNEHY